MKRFCLIMGLLLCLGSVIRAQNFTQHLQEKKQDKGNVTVTQSREIEELVNGANVSARKQEPVVSHPVTKTNNTPNKKTNSQDVVQPRHTTPQHNGDSTNTANREHARHNEQTDAKDSRTHVLPKESQKHEPVDNETETPAVDMRKKVMRRSYKVNGYRVQVYAGGNSRNDKIKAQNAGNAVKQAFPNQPVYVHFYSPRWICRVGNFRTYEEANAILHQVKKMGYKQACIVSGKITVAY